MEFSKRQLLYSAGFFALIMLLGVFMGLMGAVAFKHVIYSDVACAAMIATPIATVGMLVFCFAPDWY